MNPQQIVLATGLLLYGALYVAGVFIAGLVNHNAAAVILAITCAGATYLTYFAQLSAELPDNLRTVIVYATIALGALAGIVLL